LLLLTFGTGAFAQNEIFVCVDEQGHKTFQNTGNLKGCKRLDVQPIVTVPAPKLPARPAVQPALEQRATTPANFPRVDGETQRARDNDRRRILEDELKAEEERLAQLRAEFNGGRPEPRGEELRDGSLLEQRLRRLQDDIQRAENSVVSLRRELLLLTRQ
jgi:hypothetical protein